MNQLSHLVVAEKTKMHNLENYFGIAHHNKTANQRMNRTLIHPMVRLEKLSLSCSLSFLGCISARYPIR